MNTEDETGEMYLQATDYQEFQGITETGKGKETFCPRPFQGFNSSVDILNLNFWLPELLENKFLFILFFTFFHPPSFIDIIDIQHCVSLSHTA